MGNLSSKIFHWSSETTTTKQSSSTIKKSAVRINDPRSPTEGVNRTPIIVDKSKPYLETDFDSDSPVHRSSNVSLRKKIWRNIKIDSKFSEPEPDDYTESDDTKSSSSKFCDAETPEKCVIEKSYCDSPLSVYSCNVSNLDSVIDITAPPEPSAIVSDFEPDESGATEYQEMFLTQIDNLIDKLRASEAIDSSDTDNVDSFNSARNDGSVHTVKELPNDDNVKGECVLQEEKGLLIEYVEPQLKLINPNEIVTISKVEKITEKTELIKNDPVKLITHKKLSDIHVKKERENISPQSRIPIKIKPRTPLANITSLSNSPNQVLRSKHANLLKNQTKGIENYNQKQIIGEWDQNNTVII